MERHMRPGSREFDTYRADCKAYLEFCQDHRVPGALSEFALYCWIACLEGEGVLAVDRARMRASVETPFQLRLRLARRVCRHRRESFHPCLRERRRRKELPENAEAAAHTSQCFRAEA